MLQIQRVENNSDLGRSQCLAAFCNLEWEILKVYIDLENVEEEKKYLRRFMEQITFELS